MHSGCEINNFLSLYKLFTFFERKMENGFFFKGESHDFYEIVCVISGTVGITAGKKIYSLKSGEMIFHPPGEFHAIWEEKNSNPEVIIFSFASNHFPIVNQKVYSLNKESISDILSIYEDVTKNFNLKSGSVLSLKENREAEASLTVKKLEMFLISVLRQDEGYTAQSQKSTTKLFSKILSVMEANISKQLRITDIARLCEISVPTLEKTVNKYLGYGAMTHYNILKAQRAHTMLLSGANVKETAFALGYINQNYFSARFKKYYGYSPSEVRKK